MQLRPIKTKRIYEEIVEQIRKLVTEGQLRPGDRLPSERHLAERLQVSRASVREALSALEMMGLLEIRSGEGTYIRQVNIESVIAPLAWVLSVERDTLLELLEVRKILEVQAVGLAAERSDEEDIAELKEIIQKMKIDLETNQIGEKADHHFHYAIARATHNKVLIRLMNTISDTMQQTLKASRVKLYEMDQMPQRLYEEHVAVFEAIQAGKASVARDLMLAHLVGVENEMVKDLD